MEQVAPPIAAGETLGRYKIIGEIGRGAMAVVYLAEELGRSRLVAVKILLPMYEGDAAYVNRFINEARAAGSLTHPNIIEALDIGCELGMHYFCMEYVDGKSLQEMITEQGKVPLGRLLDIVIEVAEALEYGWTRHGLTHGDIKPENIMLKSTGEAKLADFGLANMKGHERQESDILLTPHYAAPELIKGTSKMGDCRTDIYALGATIYHAVSGSPLFPGTNAQKVLDKQVHENPEPLVLRCPEAPPLLSQLVGRMVAKNPDERPQDWTEVLGDLRSIRHSLGGNRVPLVSSDAQNEAAEPVVQHVDLPSKPSFKVSVILFVVGGVLVFAAIMFILYVTLWREAHAMDEPAVENVETTAENSSVEEEAKRLAEEKAEEEKRLAEEKAEEEKRLAAEKAAEEKRLAEEKAAEAKRLAEERRLAKEKAAEAKRLAEEKRLAAEKAAEAKRLAEEKAAEAKRQAEEKRLAEQKKLADQRTAELIKRQAELKRLAEEKRLAEQRAAEKKRKEERRRKREREREREREKKQRKKDKDKD